MNVIRMLGLVAAAALLAAGPAARVNSWTTPHVLVISDAGNPSTLNPHLSGSAPTANLSEMTMAFLLRYDEHNNLYPELATAIPSQENGGVSKDGLTITYHLRKGVRWSDGAPFSADDVIFTTNLTNNPANDEQARFDMVSKMDEPDKYTVVFHLKKPYASFLVGFYSSCCANEPILPKHLLAKYKSINNAPYNSLPVGIGPYRFERWDKDKQVVLVANPLYWRGEPKIKKIIYKVIPSRDALLAAMQAHHVDLWYQFSGTYLPQIQALEGFSVVRHPSYAYNHIDFNTTHKVVAERAVRQALRLAIDRKAIIDRLAHGVGIVQDSATPVSAPYFTDVGTTAYDPAMANALLDRAGWLRGSDGVRAKDGVRLVINFAAQEGQQDNDEVLATYADYWKAIGVETSIQHYPAVDMFTPKVVFGNGWDAVSFAWAATPDGDFSGMYACNQFPPAGGNDLRWCNKAADAAMSAFYGHYRAAQRTADIKTVMLALNKDVPTIVTSIREDLFAYNKDLKNYRPNNVTPFDNMMNVDI